MTDAGLQQLLNWGVAHGAKISPAIQFQFNKQKGLHAVAKEDVVSPSIQIPKSVMINTNLAASVFNKRSTDNDINSWLKLLVAQLKFGMHAATVDNVNLCVKFAPYIKLLPLIVDSPLLWRPQELLLLKDTNLGNSLKEKLYCILEEWHAIVPYCCPTEEIQGDLRIYTDFDSLTQDEIYHSIVQPLYENSNVKWYSLTAFLWSHLVFTSRAFPEAVVDPNAGKTSVVLLPIIDLMNHDNNSKVEWIHDDEGNFTYKNMEQILKGMEISNNYGGKSNEELLYGYGFTIEDNLFDSVMLKLKLPAHTIESIINLNHPLLKLPTISNYTWSVFDPAIKRNMVERKRELSDYQDGVIYLINSTNKNCLEPLLHLFAYLSIINDEVWTDTRPSFEGLQALRNALNRKLKPLQHSTLKEERNCEIGEYRLKIAQTYRNGQINILKNALSTLKQTEKSWLTKYKSQLLTGAKILKHDLRFTQEELTANEITFNTNQDLLVLWLLIKLRNNSFPEKYRWVYDQYEQYAALQKDLLEKELAQEIYSDFTSNINASLEWLSPMSVVLALNFVRDNSFIRLQRSLDEVILVRQNK